jgi:hypothetical protein
LCASVGMSVGSFGSERACAPQAPSAAKIGGNHKCARTIFTKIVARGDKKGDFLAMAFRPDLIARASVVVLYLGVQTALIATAGSRADNAFGFRMFNESSSVEAHLFREVESPSGHGTVRVQVVDGKWRAKDDAGNLHTFSWYERVKSGAVASLDARQHASYGAGAQVERLHAALDDVAAHVVGDSETSALVLVISVSKNGHAPEPVEFVAKVSR